MRRRVASLAENDSPTRWKLYNVSVGGLTVEAVALPLFPALEAPRTTDAGAVADWEDRTRRKVVRGASAKRS
jgi:hypothetical protein